MNIYFSAPITGDGEFLAQYKKIIYLIRSGSHQLTSGEQIISASRLEQDKKLTAQAIFQRERQAIDTSDCVIAEVTKPSSGVGGEIVYALMHHKPVLALFYKDVRNLLSPMIAGNPSDFLYLEHYSDSNLHLVLNNYLKQVEVLKQKKGRLIVIDGGDGSGKTVQSELLIKYLVGQGVKVKYLDFPRYYTSFHGRIVGRFLAGEFGKLDDVSPYLASLAYALDRASAKQEMDEWLSHGGLIVSNRYATSNMAHQGARLPEAKRKEFVEWVDELEYKVHKIPREDIVIYLYVPWQIGLELTKKKGDRAYLGKGQDILEMDLLHRQASEQMYLKLVKLRRNWVSIDCTEKGKLLPKEEIHRKLLQVLRQKKLIS